MIRRWARSVIAVAAAVVLQHGAPATASPGIGGFTVQPVASNADPVSSGYFHPMLRAGAVRVSRVVVSNQSDRPIDLIVSAVDGLTGQTSGTVFANREDPVTQVGRWLRPDTARLRLGARARDTVRFSVTVPAGAQPGDHLAGLAVENAAAQVSGGGVQIRQVLRMVIGVLVTIPGPADFSPALRSLALAELPGPRVGSVTVGLVNSGAALGKATLSVSLAGPGGYRRTLTRTLDTILPGSVIAYPFTWPDALAPGHYDISATVVGDTSSTLRGEGRLADGLAGVDQRAPPPDKAGFGATTVTVLALVALALAGGLGYLLLRRHRAGPARPAPARPARRSGRRTVTREPLDLVMMQSRIDRL